MSYEFETFREQLKTYPDEVLKTLLQQMNSAQFPDRYQAVLGEIQRRGAMGPGPDLSVSGPVAWTQAPTPAAPPARPQSSQAPYQYYASARPQITGNRGFSKSEWDRKVRNLLFIAVLILFVGTISFVAMGVLCDNFISEQNTFNFRAFMRITSRIHSELDLPMVQVGSRSMGYRNENIYVTINTSQTAEELGDKIDGIYRICLEEMELSDNDVITIVLFQNDNNGIVNYSNRREISLSVGEIRRKLNAPGGRRLKPGEKVI